MIRKLKSGEYRLYSRKKDPKTGKRRNLGTFSSRQKAEAHERFEGLRGLLKEAFHSLGGGESFLREERVPAGTAQALQYSSVARMQWQRQRD